MTESADRETIAAIVKAANFVDLVNQIWRAIQADEPTTLPLSILSDALIDAGHVDAGLAVLGIAELGRGTLVISQVTSTGIAPRRGEKFPGRDLRITACYRPPTRPDDDDDAGRWPVKKSR